MKKIPKSLEILKREKDVLGLAGCPRPLIAPYPLVVEHAQGAILTDVDGNDYIDFSAQGTVAGTGFCHQKILNVIQNQFEKITALGLWSSSHPISVQLAEKLIEILPSKTWKRKVIFGFSGSDACDCVYKLLPLSTKRPRIISFLGGYHGTNMGAYSLSGMKGLSKIIGFPNVTKVPYAYCYRCPFKLSYPDCSFYCVDFIEEHIFTTICPPEDTSSLIFEPVASDGGEIVPPQGYYKKLASLCKKYNMLLVTDEVKVGFGRTGRMFAVEHEGVNADIFVLGKSIASGMPLSAVIAPAEITDIMGAHAFTLSGHPVSCAASLATIEILENEKLPNNAEKQGRYMLKRLKEVQEEHSIIGDVRGKGLIIGLELVKNRKTKEPAPIEALKICYRAWELGLIVTSVGIHSNVIEITPPLIISESLAQKGLNILEEAIKDVESGKIQDDKLSFF